jgi:hypothetical protein
MFATKSSRARLGGLDGLRARFDSCGFVAAAELAKDLSFGGEINQIRAVGAELFFRQRHSSGVTDCDLSGLPH